MTLFFRFDKTHSDDELLFLECFCNIADGIEVRYLMSQYVISYSQGKTVFYAYLDLNIFYQNDENGNQLKNIIIDKGLVQQAVQYLELYTPSQSFRYVRYS